MPRYDSRCAMLDLSAQSSINLLRQLAAIDISVPLRTEGRTTEHCERWSICRFLAAYAATDLLGYPLRIGKRERPDFLLTLPAGEFGIEVTEAVPSDWAWADARHERLDYDNMVFLHRFRPGEPKRPKDEIDAIARGDTWGAGWVGDAPEREWAEVMLHFSLQKSKVLAKPGYDRFSGDWLLIYDNWPLPAVNARHAAAYFCDRLRALDAPPPFARIFVECGSAIWQFGPGEPAIQPIVDMWRSENSELENAST